ncbi:hypothetical protein M427DRAFT_29147 [Gonapodya prolifera JEL478]|uniref:Uncharacterized protein n=1 Tax=Gonapodya prolifera (strain JEL478) TaxID=1344416 RepID=A0A139AR31_GONPJ|nr:hypothetical protein M427DRAFT_29147 [Gonapodya prolifera JEL478]|eukprot:KXS19172.1 hypothetical protein M427DRAFT_29147 [Gonapodya prolifera JEL478]
MNRRQVITLTFGERAENHKGMEIIGQAIAAGQGFQLADLVAIQGDVRARGGQTELHTLDSGHEKAYVLVIRGGVDVFLRPHGQTHATLFDEQKALTYDKKAHIYGRVVNKHARWNLCFDDDAREPDYERGRGRIVDFDQVPVLKSLREEISHLGAKTNDLKVESNYYYDVEKCGIGFHGDSERRKVIGVRLGTVGTPLFFQWYKNGRPLGGFVEIALAPGDMYFMSEKAVVAELFRIVNAQLNLDGAERHAIAPAQKDDEQDEEDESLWYTAIPPIVGGTRETSPACTDRRVQRNGGLHPRHLGTAAPTKAKLSVLPEAWEMKESDLVIFFERDALGEGGYGVVHRRKWLGAIEVAVKVVKFRDVYNQKIRAVVSYPRSGCFADNVAV